MKLGQNELVTHKLLLLAKFYNDWVKIVDWG